jgi:hypothetical protein
MNTTGASIMMTRAMASRDTSAVIEAMRRNPKDRSVQEAGGVALAKLCNAGPEHAQALSEEASANVVLDAMETFRRSGAIQNFGFVAFGKQLLSLKEIRSFVFVLVFVSVYDEC